MKRARDRKTGRFLSKRQISARKAWKIRKQGLLRLWNKQAKKVHKKFGKPLSKRKLKKKLREFDLCHISQRRLFFEQLLEDMDEQTDQLPSELKGSVRFLMDIGLSPAKKGKIKDKRKNVFKGHRVFIDRRKIKNFLNISGDYHTETGGKIDWTKRGFCKWRKDARVSYFKMQGKRVLGEKRLVNYTLTGEITQ